MAKLVNLILTALLACSISMLSPAIYAGNGNNPSNHTSTGHGKIKKAKIKKYVKKPQSAKATVKFSDRDTVQLINYFRANPMTSTALPPGIAKNLARGKPLPPGIAEKVLPADALSVLPRHPGYEYLVVGRDILLVNSTTRIINDMLKNILQ